MSLCRWSRFTDVALSPVKAFHLDAHGKETTSRPSACAGVAIDWLAGPRPVHAWPDSRYFLLYDGVGHPGVDPSAASQTAIAEAMVYFTNEVSCQVNLQMPKGTRWGTAGPPHPYKLNWVDALYATRCVAKKDEGSSPRRRNDTVKPAALT